MPKDTSEQNRAHGTTTPAPPTLHPGVTHSSSSAERLVSTNTRMRPSSTLSSFRISWASLSRSSTNSTWGQPATAARKAHTGTCSRTHVQNTPPWTTEERGRAEAAGEGKGERGCSKPRRHNQHPDKRGCRVGVQLKHTKAAQGKGRGRAFPAPTPAPPPTRAPGGPSRTTSVPRSTHQRRQRKGGGDGGWGRSSTHRCCCTAMDQWRLECSKGLATPRH